MKNREKTGKAFRIKWLLLALVAAALIFVPAASHKVSAAKLVYTVKFNNNSGTSKSKTYTALTRNVTLNTTIRLPAVPKAVGYQNLGWTTRKGSSKVVYKAGARVKVRKDMTLYAVRRKSRYYTVNFYLGNGSTNSAYKKLQKKVEEGTYYTLPAVPSRSGYVNLGWSTAKNGKASTAKKPQTPWSRQTGEVQGISFSKGEYTFKGSEIDRSFSFSKLDKCFGDAGLSTAGNNRQTVSVPVQEPAQTPGKADSPLLAGLGGLLSASSSPADETPDNPCERKKRKKKRHLKL